MLYSLIKKGHVRGQNYFTLMMLTVTWYCFAGTIESAVTSIELKVLWSQLEYFGAAFASTFALLFTINFIGVSRKGIQKHLALFYVIPFVSLLLTLTNQYHSIIWDGFTWSNAGENILTYSHNYGFFLLIGYSLLQLAMAVVIIYRSIPYLPKIIRKQAWILISGFLFPFIMTFFYALDITPVEGLDLTIMSFAITSPVLLIGILKFGMFRILPSVTTQVANMIQDGLVILDEFRDIAYYNEAAIKILKINQKSFYHKDIKHIIWLSDLLMENNTKNCYEAEVMIESSPEKWLLVNVNEIKNEDGLMKGNLLLMHDITNRKRLEQHTRRLLDELKISHQQMKEANSQKDRIVSIIAHDLRTPFHQISNLSSISIDMFEDLSNSQILEFINDIKNASETGNSILEELLGWAKMQQKNANSLIESVHVSNTLEPIIESMNLSLKDKNLKVELTGKTDMEMKTDNNVLSFVSRNLLANAIKFSNPESKITISLEQDDDVYSINFIDQGIGIPHSDLNKLFDSKVKFSRPGTQGEKGSGIGLLLCKEMIERINGKIEVDSQEGYGSTFSIKFQKNQV